GTGLRGPGRVDLAARMEKHRRGLVSPPWGGSAAASAPDPTCLVCGAFGGAAAVFHRPVVPHVLRAGRGPGRAGAAPHLRRDAAGGGAVPGLAAGPGALLFRPGPVGDRRTGPGRRPAGGAAVSGARRPAFGGGR